MIEVDWTYKIGEASEARPEVNRAARAFDKEALRLVTRKWPEVDLRVLRPRFHSSGETGVWRTSHDNLDAYESWWKELWKDSEIADIVERIETLTKERQRALFWGHRTEFFSRVSSGDVTA